MMLFRVDRSVPEGLHAGDIMQVLKAQGRKVTAPVPAINDEQAWFDFIRRKRRTPSTHVILSLDNVRR